MRKRVELSGIHAGRHNKIACALRRGTYKHRSLNFHELTGIQEVAYKNRHPVPKLKVLANAIASQVKVTILHAEVIAAIGLFLNSERRGERGTENGQLADDNLYVASSHFVVLVLTLRDNALRLNTIFSS